MSNKPKLRDMLGRQGLTNVTEARSLILDCLSQIPIEQETVSLDKSLDRITATSILAPEDLPTHARSVMDGFAVFSADTFGASQSMPCYLTITGDIAMGELPTASLTRGNCVRISTGGLLPPGSDAVVMFEHTVPVDETMIEIVKSVGAGTHLIQPGEDIQKNAPAIQKGHLLRPQDLGLLAGLGITEMKVNRKVRIGILATGDEIVPYKESPPPGKIRNINTITLSSLVSRLGAEVNDYGIVSDTEEIFYPAIERAVAENDLVLFSGGSSVGVRDLGEQAIERLGNPGILIHGVALKPGKPIIIGLTETTPVFGLPGHPVSAMVCFDLFVKPTIEKLAGIQNEHSFPSPCIMAILDRNINSAAGRKDLIRVQVEQKGKDCIAQPVLGKSGSISTLSRAHGYFFIDESSQGVAAGTIVEVHLYT